MKSFFISLVVACLLCAGATTASATVTGGVVASDEPVAGGTPVSPETTTGTSAPASAGPQTAAAPAGSQPTTAPPAPTSPAVVPQARTQLAPWTVRRTYLHLYHRLRRLGVKVGPSLIARAVVRGQASSERIGMRMVTAAQLRAAIRRMRAQLVYWTHGEGFWIRKRAQIPPAGRAWIMRLVNCESGSSGRYRANTGNGFYGGTQFDRTTWYGTTQYGLPKPKTMPHLASPAEQDVRTWVVRLHRGVSPWPHCGPRAL